MIMNDRLRAARETVGLSLSKAARMVGCSKAHLWELEAGRAHNPGIQLLTKAASIYATRVAWLIGETNDKIGPSMRYVLALSCEDISASELERLRCQSDMESGSA